MFTCSSGSARLCLSGSDEKAKRIAPFLRLIMGDMSELQQYDLVQIKSLCALSDKYECASLRVLLRSQLTHLAVCGHNSRFDIFMMAVEDRDWRTCAEALRVSSAGAVWPKVDSATPCTVCAAPPRHPTAATPIRLFNSHSRITLLDPASLDLERFSTLAQYPAVHLALIRAIEYSKTRKGCVSASTVSAFFLQFMLEHERRSLPALCAM